MKDEDMHRRTPSRRGFIGGALLVAGSAVMLTAPSGGLAWRMPAMPRMRRTVVAFHYDQLYIDRSGSAEPYIPPVGLRSLDGFDEEAIRRLVYHL
jgi:hypothetical protein